MLRVRGGQSGCDYCLAAALADVCFSMFCYPPLSRYPGFMPTLLEVSADAVRELNRSFGGTHEMNSTVEAAFQSTYYVLGFWEKVATVVRSIAGGHLFHNGNKRTALAVVELFRDRNNIFTGAPDDTLRETVRLVATNQLRDVSAIAISLRGF